MLNQWIGIENALNICLLHHIVFILLFFACVTLAKSRWGARNIDFKDYLACGL